MDHPPLPPGIAVLAGTVVEDAWARFLSMEALHHLHEICNPMTPADLDRVVHAAAPSDGDRVVDVACGHGEFLIRMAERSAIRGVGLDLSPWVLTRALARSASRPMKGKIEWRLGDGASLAADPAWDVASCLGASWVWHGFEGTVRAMAARIRSGGRIVIGDLRLRRNIHPDSVELGARPLTESDQLDAFRELDLRPVDQIIADDRAWEGYHRLVVQSADSFAEAHPEDPAADFRKLANEWMDEFEKDRRFMEWTVWVARRRTTV